MQRPLEQERGAGVHPYATATYANTLAHIGRPQFIEPWHTHVLMRNCPGNAVDASGTYPLTCIARESNLGDGLEQLRAMGAVSVTIVDDGLSGPSPDQLRAQFSFARPFKTHYVCDPAAGTYQPSKHHRYEIRRAAQRGVDVRIVELPSVLDSWTELYNGLISRHDIAEPQRFSRESFAALATCDGLVTVGAYVGTDLVSCHLWFRYKSYVWSHLAASNALGYATGAAYAVYDFSIRHFADHVINLGGSAGIADDLDDGLARLKSGFANRTLTTTVFGAVLDTHAYGRLCSEHGSSTEGYFPAYRSPVVSRS